MTFDDLRAQLARTVGARYVVLGIVLPVLVYFSYTAIGVGQPPTSIRAMDWRTYFMVSMAAFAAMNTAVVSGSLAWARRSAGAGREANRRPAIGPAIAALVLVLPPLAIVSLAGRLEGVRLDAPTWLDVGLALCVGSLPFLVLGLTLRRILLGEGGNLVLVGMLVVVAILGGLFQPVETMAPALTAIAPALPSYRLADLGWTAIATSRPSLVDGLILAAYTVVIAGALALGRRTGATDHGG